MAERQARHTQDEEHQPPGAKREQEGESGGIEPGSPQHGVARLQAAAGNQALGGMLQRFHGRPEAVDAVPGGDAAPLAREPAGGGFIGGARQGLQQGRRPGIAQAVVRGAGSAPQAGLPPAALGGSSGRLAQTLRGLTLANLGEADSATRNLAGGLAGAVGDAWSTWQSQAAISGVTVNGNTAWGGQVSGPSLRALIKDRSAVDRVAGVVLADAIGQAFDIFVTSLRVPGLPLFPSFAAVPSPVAPPTPSQPVALVALAGVQPAPRRDFSVLSPTQQLACLAIVDAFEPAFTIWRTTTRVSLTGAGPVPTFAPPYVPVGRVAGGVASGLPGSFLL